MITKAVQIQLQHFQVPKQRPSSFLAEEAEMAKILHGECVGGGASSLPSANPDNVAAGGATDARCGGGGEGGGESWRGTDNSP